MSGAIFPLPPTSLWSGALLKALLNLTTGIAVVTIFTFIYKFTWNKTFDTKILLESHVNYMTKHCIFSLDAFLFVMGNYNMPSTACYLFVNSTGALASLRR
jgi:hypothetical protein